MKMTKIGIGLATTAAMTVGMVLSSSPARAMGSNLSDDPLKGVLGIHLPNLIESIDADFIDFGDDNGSGSTGTVGTTTLDATDFQANPAAGFFGSTGSFSQITGGVIKDLKIGASFPTGGVMEFLTLNDGSGTTVTFDLLGFIREDFNNGTFEANVRGIFNPTGQGAASSDVFQFRLTNRANIGTIELTPVPTPAVIPGLIGMGVAALRKKNKSEESDLSEAEA